LIDSLILRRNLISLSVFNAIFLIFGSGLFLGHSVGLYFDGLAYMHMLLSICKLFEIFYSQYSVVFVPLSEQTVC